MFASLTSERRRLLGIRHAATVYLLLAAVTGLALALRLYRLGHWSFWGDEMLSVANVADGFNYNLIRQSLSLSLIQVSIAQLGLSEWSARLAPALIGALSTPVLYLPARKIFDRSVALLFTLLLAVSPWHLYWSQNARFYTLLLLFYTLGLMLLFLGLEEDRPRYLAAGALFLGLAARESLLALFILPVVGGYLLLLRALPLQRPPGLRRLPRLLLLLSPALLIGLYFIYPYLQNLSGWLEAFGRPNNSPLWLGAGIVYYVRLPVVIVGGAAAAALIARGERRGLFFLLAALLPPLLLLLLAPVHYTASRYAFVSLSAWLLLAAHGVVALVRRAPRHGAALALGIILLLPADALAEDVLYFAYQNGNREDWKSALAYVAETKGANDVVISRHNLLADYYLGEDTVHVNRFPWPEGVADAQAPLWFVEDMLLARHFPQQHRWIVSNARLVAVHDVRAHGRTFTMRVYRYDPASPP